MIHIQILVVNNGLKNFDTIYLSLDNESQLLLKSVFISTIKAPKLNSFLLCVSKTFHIPIHI